MYFIPTDKMVIGSGLQFIYTIFCLVCKQMENNNNRKREQERKSETFAEKITIYEWIRYQN